MAHKLVVRWRRSQYFYSDAATYPGLLCWGGMTDPEGEAMKLRQSAKQARVMAARSPFKTDRDRFLRIAEEYERRAAKA